MRRRGVSLRSVTHMIVWGSHAETSSDTDHPTPAHLAHWRDKIRPARAAQGRFRYKTLPARPTSPHVRYKTLPARPKWPNLAQSTHAGRVLYRSHHQEAKQGEFCTEREAEIELGGTTAHQAPPAWNGRPPGIRRYPRRCRWTASRPGEASRRDTETTPHKFRT